LAPNLRRIKHKNTIRPWYWWLGLFHIPFAERWLLILEEYR
jgi:hypothetical protein